jgi:hypothetical protein
MAQNHKDKGEEEIVNERIPLTAALEVSLAVGIVLNVGGMLDKTHVYRDKARR